MSDLKQFYETLKFEPFEAARTGEWGTVPDEVYERVRPGAVLRVETLAPLPADWKEAAQKVSLWGYRVALEFDGCELVEETETGWIYRGEISFYDEHGEVTTKTYTIELPRDPEKIVEFVAKLEEIQRGASPSPTDDERKSECRYRVEQAYEFDEEASILHKYVLVGDVNRILGVCDDCTTFDWEDINGIAYLDEYLQPPESNP